MENLPKRYRKVTYDYKRAIELLKQKRFAVVPSSLWQTINKEFGKPICLRGIFGDIVVLHRYPPKP